MVRFPRAHVRARCGLALLLIGSVALVSTFGLAATYTDPSAAQDTTHVAVGGVTGDVGGLGGVGSNCQEVWGDYGYLVIGEEPIRGDEPNTKKKNILFWSRLAANAVLQVVAGPR